MAKLIKHEGSCGVDLLEGVDSAAAARDGFATPRDTVSGVPGDVALNALDKGSEPAAGDWEPVPHPKRVKGRPMRGPAEVGRDKLIEAARAILRVRMPPDVSRKAVAAAAGVSPALVTYYFPDKNSLVTAATQPVVGRLLISILEVLERPTSHLERLRDIARLFLDLNDAERSLVDIMGAFGHNAAGDDPSRSVLETACQRLLAFHAEGVAAGTWRAIDGRVFVAAMWGMCHAVAVHGRCAQEPGCSEAAARDSQVHAVVDFALNGMTSRHAA